MERDFLGLNSKESLFVVKEEVNADGYKEIGSKSSGIQWPFSNKVSAVPQLMSFNFAQGDKNKRIGSDSLVAPGFMPISTADAAEVQKPFTHNMQQGGRHFSLTTSVQHNVHPVQCPYDLKMFPVSNQATSVPVSNPFLKNHLATTGQNLPVTTMKPQLLGGIPVTTQHSILPTLGSVGGSIEPWKSVRASGSPAQLTIFYAGTVNVYDDITPEKAQAIMFLAGNGSSMASNVAHPKIQVETPISKPVQVDSVPANQLINTQLSSGISSPLSVSSHTGAQPRSRSTSSDELMVGKTTGSPTNPISKVEPPKLVNNMGSVAATSMMPSVPQARKASLARFLEKRKERVMSVAPYDPNKKSQHCFTLEPNA